MRDWDGEEAEGPERMRREEEWGPQWVRREGFAAMGRSNKIGIEGPGP